MPRVDYALSPEQKIDARGALEVLRGTGYSLTDAAKALLEKKRPARQVSVEQAVDEFLRAKLRAEKRSKTISWYQDRLGQLVAEFGERRMGSVTRPDLDAWLDRLETGAAAKSANARAARALWLWAVRQYPPLAVDNPTLGSEYLTKPKSKGQPVVLTVEQCVAIMEGADRHQNALALMLFGGGIRPEEIAGRDKPWLRGRAINAVDKIIRIPEECSKVGRDRVVEDLPTTLWTWWDYVPPAETISQTTARAIVERAALLAGYQAPGAAPENRGKWPQDALRHTFASYALALTADPGKVSVWIGHEGRATLLHTTYRGVHTADNETVTRAMAERFFAIRRLVAI